MTLHPDEMENIEIEDKLRILYAEDEESIRKSITLRLEDEGHEVFSVKDGREALELFRKEKNNGIDVAVTDIDMPCMRGGELIQILREKEKFKGTIIISSIQDISEDFIKKYDVAYVTPTFKSDFVEYLKSLRK